MEKYKSIKVYVENDTYVSADVFYNDGTNKYYEGSDNVAAVLSDYSIDSGVNILELASDPKSVVKFSDIKERVVEEPVHVEEPVVEVEEPVHVEEPVVETESSTIVRNRRSERTTKKRSIKKYIAIAGVGAIILSMIPIGKTILKKEKKYTSEKETNIEQTYDNANYVSSVDHYVNPQIDQEYVRKLNEVNSNFGTYLQESNQVVNNAPITEREFFDTLNDTNHVVFSGIEELIQFFSGSRMTKVGIKPLEDMFANGSNEYVAVQYFRNLRNNIYDNAYRYQDRERTRREVYDFLNKYVAYVYEADTINGKYNDYYDLDNMARYIILGLGSSMLQVDFSYSKDVNGYQYDAGMLMNDSQVQLDDIVSRWSENINRK